jgi:hypothetical protein
MAFDKYKNGAWQEPEDSAYRYSNGAWQEAEAAYRNINGAWQEVWYSLPVMTVGECTLTNGQIDISDDKRSFNFDRFEDKEQNYGSLSGGGRIKFVLDIEPTNSVNIRFGWMGGMNYCSNNYSMFFQSRMGSISVGYTTANGSSTTLGSITVGGQEKNSTGWILSYGDFDKTATSSGSPITQVYIILYPDDNSGSTYWNGGMECEIYSVYVNNEKVGFIPEAESYSKYISDY